VAKINIAAQIAEVDYELNMRRRVYSSGRGTMSRAERELHMAQMEAIKLSLLWLQANEANIRNWAASQQIQLAEIKDNGTQETE
jgi:hypothetical protein